MLQLRIKSPGVGVRGVLGKLRSQIATNLRMLSNPRKLMDPTRLVQIRRIRRKRRQQRQKSPSRNQLRLLRVKFPFNR